jgi:hypothetical protein
VPVGPLGGWYRWRGHDDMGSIEEDTVEARPNEWNAGEPYDTYGRGEPQRQRA